MIGIIPIVLIIAAIVGSLFVADYISSGKVFSSLPGGNVTPASIGDSGKIDVGGTIKWAKSVPLKDFWDSVTAGTTGIINWLSSGFTGLLTFVVHILSPSTVVPSWIGWLAILGLIGGLIWWQFDNLWDWMHNMVFWVVIIIILVVVIGIFLIYLGVLK